MLIHEQHKDISCIILGLSQVLRLEGHTQITLET